MSAQTAAGADEMVDIEVTLHLELPAGDVWPDGDMPEAWTAADVLAVVQESGTFRKFNEDWDADLFGAEVNVYARGKSERGSLR